MLLDSRVPCKAYWMRVTTMPLRPRPYGRAVDYGPVGAFLVRTYRTGGAHVNWLQPRWEYMHHHPNVRHLDLRAIGLWEARGRVVGVVHPEGMPGEAYFQLDPRYGFLRSAMLAHAERHLSHAVGGERRLIVACGDRDRRLQARLARRGYARTGDRDPTSRLDLAGPESVERPTLPPGFQLQSLAEDNDLARVDRVLWRGFGHGDDPPAGGEADRAFVQSAPNYRKDLNIVVRAPDGSFASYCGMWFEPTHAVAMVEPVATDPAWRRRGLGRAAVLEGCRRCAALGAVVALVGSEQPFYRALGFRSAYGSSYWSRRWPDDTGRG